MHYSALSVWMLDCLATLSVMLAMVDFKLVWEKSQCNVCVVG